VKHILLLFLLSFSISVFGAEPTTNTVRITKQSGGDQPSKLSTTAYSASADPDLRLSGKVVPTANEIIAGAGIAIAYPVYPDRYTTVTATGATAGDSSTSVTAGLNIQTTATVSGSNTSYAVGTTANVVTSASLTQTLNAYATLVYVANSISTALIPYAKSADLQTTFTLYPRFTDFQATAPLTVTQNGSKVAYGITLPSDSSTSVTAGSNLTVGAVVSGANTNYTVSAASNVVTSASLTAQNYLTTTPTLQQTTDQGFQTTKPLFSTNTIGTSTTFVENGNQVPNVNEVLGAGINTQSVSGSNVTITGTIPSNYVTSASLATATTTSTLAGIVNTRIGDALTTYAKSYGEDVITTGGEYSVPTTWTLVGKFRSGTDYNDYNTTYAVISAPITYAPVFPGSTSYTTRTMQNAFSILDPLAGNATFTIGSNSGGITNIGGLLSTSGNVIVSKGFVKARGFTPVVPDFWASVPDGTLNGDNVVANNDVHAQSLGYFNQGIVSGPGQAAIGNTTGTLIQGYSGVPGVGWTAGTLIAQLTPFTDGYRINLSDSVYKNSYGNNWLHVFGTGIWAHVGTETGGGKGYFEGDIATSSTIRENGARFLAPSRVTAGTGISATTSDTNGTAVITNTGVITEADTLQTVTARGATSSIASTFSNGLTASKSGTGLTVTNDASVGGALTVTGAATVTGQALFNGNSGAQITDQPTGTNTEARMALNGTGTAGGDLRIGQPGSTGTTPNSEFYLIQGDTANRLDIWANSASARSILFFNLGGGGVNVAMQNRLGVNTSTAPTSGASTQGQSYSEGVVSKTGTYTAIDTDSTILCNTASGSFTVTLPTFTGRAGQRWTAIHTNNTNSLTVGTTGGQTINGATTDAMGTTLYLSHTYVVNDAGTAAYIQ
jgi:hypothetical protein